MFKYVLMFNVLSMCRTSCKSISGHRVVLSICNNCSRALRRKRRKRKIRRRFCKKESAFIVQKSSLLKITKRQEKFDASNATGSMMNGMRNEGINIEKQKSI